MAIVSIRITSRELQVSLVGMICCNRYIMHIFQVYSNNVSKAKVIPPVCVSAQLPSPQLLLIIRAPACHHILTPSSTLATTLSKFCHTEKSIKLLNTENCGSINILQKLVNLRDSPRYSQFFYFSCPQVSRSPISHVYPSIWLPPSPPQTNSKQTYRTSGQKCTRTPQNRASCCRQ